MKHDIKLNSPVLACCVLKCGTHLLDAVLRSIIGTNNVIPDLTRQIPMTQDGFYSNPTLENKVYVGNIAYDYTLQKILQDIPKIILIRDPRDYVVSHAHFFDYLNPNDSIVRRKFRTFDWDSKISAIIFGMREIDEIVPPAYEVLLKQGIKWLTGKSLLIRYEELVKIRSNYKSDEVRETIRKIADFVGVHLYDEDHLLESIYSWTDPSKSRTFREGTTGSWRQEFKPHHVLQMKLAAPRLVSALGYEDDEDWDLTRSLKTYKQIDMELAQSLPLIPPNFKEVYHKMNSLSNTPDVSHILDVWYFKNNLDSGNFELAIGTLQKLLSKDPTNGEWNYYMAFCLHMIKKYDEAILYYNRALEMGYYEFWVRYNRGSLYLTKGEIKKANDDIEKAAILKPSHDGVKSMIELLRKHGAN